jgi:hypothetical protein
LVNIKARIDKSDDSEMAKLARAVLHQYLSVGFQTLQKRDLDLLLFYCQRAPRRASGRAEIDIERPSSLWPMEQILDSAPSTPTLLA